MTRARSTRSIGLLSGALLGVYACSFQDFDYLKEGTGGDGAAAGSAGLAGTAGSAGSAGGGGRQPLLGGAAGEPSAGGMDGGASDAGAGAGGEAPSGGTPGNGGAPGEAGSTPSEGGAPLLASGGEGGSEPDDDGGAGGQGPPVLVGNLLKNPSFEAGLTHWDVAPSSAISDRHVYVQAPTNGGTTPDGAMELATWDMNDEYEVFISQTVKNIVPGTYSFSGYFSSDRCREAYVFARNCGSDEQQVVVPTTSWEWFPISIPDIEVTGTSCEVGLFVHNVANDYLNADLFVFEKVE